MTTPAPEPVEAEKPGQQPCPHCQDGHQDPRRVPWCVYVGPERDSDGQPMHLRAERTQGSHVADSDAEWLWELIRTYRDAAMSPAPEPVAVPAAELAAAVSEESWKSSGDLCVTDPAQAAAYLLRFKCWAKSDTSKAIRAVCEDHVRMRHDLARALPVVEAAGAVVERWGPLPRSYQIDVAQTDARLADLLDALARAVCAAREPRTGEEA